MTRWDKPCWPSLSGPWSRNYNQKETTVPNQQNEAIVRHMFDMPFHQDPPSDLD